MPLDLPDTPAPPPPARLATDVWPRVVAGAAFLGLLLLVAALTARLPDLWTRLVLLPLAGGCVWALFRRPHAALSAFMVFLPVHSLVITVLLAQVGLPVPLLKVVASWKEVLLVSTLAVAVMHALRRGLPLRLSWADGLALAWVVQVLFYFLCHDLLFDWEASLVQRLYGVREWLLFLLPYGVGRLLPLTRDQVLRALRLLVAVGVATSIVGVLECLLVPTEWHVVLGVPRYFSEFLSLVYPEYMLGLPPNYWTAMGTRLVRRAVSVYLSGQAFAIPFLVILPAALWAYLVRLGPRSPRALAVCVTGVLFSLTRMTIVACLVEALAVLWLLGRRGAVLALGLGASGLLLGTMVVSRDVNEFVMNTVLLADDSAAARPAQWAEGFAQIAEAPIGQGLGSAGQVAQVFEAGGAGQEAGYLKVTTALGLPGLLAMLGWLAGLLAHARRLVASSDGVAVGVGVVVYAACVGFLVNNLAAPPDHSPMFIYVFAWLAGLAVQLVHSEPWPEPAPGEQTVPPAWAA